MGSPTEQIKDVTKSPEERLSIIQKEAENRAKTFPKNLQDPYRARVREEVSAIASVVFQMRQKGANITTIHKNLDGLIQRFQASVIQFEASNSSYYTEKKKSLDQNQARGKSLQECTYPSASKLHACLKYHPLISPYLDKKGILGQVSVEFGNEEKMKEMDRKVVAVIVADKMGRPSFPIAMTVSKALEDCSEPKNETSVVVE